MNVKNTIGSEWVQQITVLSRAYYCVDHIIVTSKILNPHIFGRAFNIFKYTSTSLFCIKMWTLSCTFVYLIHVQHSLKSGGTRYQIKRVKVPGTTPYWKDWFGLASVYGFQDYKC